MSWLDRLQARWQLNSTYQVVIVLIVFACTGFTIFFLKKPLFALFSEGEIPWWFSLLYYIFILPVYNLVLLAYGFLFGQFRFFWEFEKRMFKRIAGRP